MSPAEGSRTPQMVAITLPDGSVRAFEGPVSGAEIAGAIGPRLAKDALALKVNGAVLDLATEVEEDSAIEIVARGHPDALELLRHDCAHVMAEAIQALYPEASFAVGPPIKDGFYYDVAVDRPIAEGDLALLEAEMKKIIKRNSRFERRVLSREEALMKQHKYPDISQHKRIHRHLTRTVYATRLIFENDPKRI